MALAHVTLPQSKRLHFTLLLLLTLLHNSSVRINLKLG
jgi:hypothetical protein